jgi:hypothetical protein
MTDDEITAFLMLLIISTRVLVVSYIAGIIDFVSAAIGALAFARLVEALLVRTGIVASVGHASHIRGIRYALKYKKYIFF